jgi:hypothetical protein
MRTVTANISALTGQDYKSKEVSFTLTDRYGNVSNTIAGMPVPSTIKATTDTNSLLSVALPQSESYSSDRYFVVSFAGEIPTFKAYIPKGDGSIDLGECLLPYRCKKMAAYTKVQDGAIAVDEAFVERMDGAFVGGFLGDHDKSIMDAYLRYMDANETPSHITVEEFDAIDSRLAQNMPQNTNI